MFYIFAHSKSPKPQKPREKQMRVWDMGGNSTKDLDYSHRNGDGSQNGGKQSQEAQSDLVHTITLDFYVVILVVLFVLWPFQHATYIHIP